MTISYIKKANKTASSDEVETRQKVQDVLNEIESKRDEGIKAISRKFDKYEGDVITVSYTHLTLPTIYSV